MARLGTELAARIGRALITESNSSFPNPFMESITRANSAQNRFSRLTEPVTRGSSHRSASLNSPLSCSRFLQLGFSATRVHSQLTYLPGKSQMAFSVFNEAKSQSLDLGTETSNSLLASLGSDRCFKNAMEVFDEMNSRGVGFSTIGFGVFIWRFCRNGDLGEVLRLVDAVKRWNSLINGSVIAVLIVHGLCEASRTSEALRALNELRIRGWKPDFIAYRVVAEAFRSLGSVFDVNEVLKMKRKLGVAPRSNDYREFILCLITERRIYEAKELGEVIASGNFPMEDDVLNALIGSVSTIDPYSAIKFFHFVIGKGKFPMLLTLSNLSRNLCKHGKIDELVEGGRVREAYEVLQEMRKKGLDPDISIYNSLIEVLCREDLLRPAKRLWDEMFVIGCGGNLKTYNILIGKFSEIGQTEEAMRLFNHMLEKGLTP
ncbi:RESPIRATORY COMPLEX I CHAPERONE putative-RELATED [Salix purpurea]|uniref:RESPIRATORY COMPLEX I CHAPERONE putative-RELATED n=1 Tax=Salix purpurea TaxID=77065 RepID=A0A9Q0VVX8_SALPP|nr:RESPIRATORY COMPLEX I CHAPERONE putative-RELATED [Salix purpurea]